MKRSKSKLCWRLSLTYILGLCLVSPFISCAQSLDYRVLGEEQYYAEERNALYKGESETKYKERYEIKIDLTKIDKVENYNDAALMPSELSIEQKNEVYSKLKSALPAGSDFAIWVTRFKDSNVASVMIALPKGAEDINFENVDFVLNVGPVLRTGFYLGDPDIEPHYSLNKNWTKEKGIEAISEALHSGTKAEVETTIYFRDKHDFNLKHNNPYRKVMTHLLDGDTNGYAHVEGFTDQASFEFKVRQDHIEYLRKHPLVSNVVPNLPLKKSE